MPARTKIRSVSVEDLGNIVKQMINGALEDSAQTAKLHQAVFEEWYFKKMAEIKDAKFQEDTRKICNDKEQNDSISATSTPRRKRRARYTQYNPEPGNYEKPKIIKNTENEIHETDIKKIMNSNKNLEKKQIRTTFNLENKISSNKQDNSTCTKKSSTKIISDNTSSIFESTLIDNEMPRRITTGSMTWFSSIDISTNTSADLNVSELEDQTYHFSKYSENNISCLKKSTCHRGISTKAMQKNNIPVQTTTDKIIGSKETVEMKKVWNNSIGNVKRANYNLSGIPQETKMSKSADQSFKNALSFEDWKKKKNLMYKELFRKEQQEKQRQLEAKIAEVEYKRMQQNNFHGRKQQRPRTNRKALKQQQENQEAYEKQMEMKRMINEKAFTEWKKQKDLKLKQQKLMMMQYGYNYSPYYNPQLQQETPPQPVEDVGNKFNSWLNQLDWVLHEKYLRERRYLVRSFYCQPAYYGNAADIAYANCM